MKKTRTNVYVLTYVVSVSMAIYSLPECHSENYKMIKAAFSYKKKSWKNTASNPQSGNHKALIIPKFPVNFLKFILNSYLLHWIPQQNMKTFFCFIGINVGTNSSIL